MDYPEECFAGATDDVRKLPVSRVVLSEKEEDEEGEHRREYPDVEWSVVNSKGFGD